MKRRSWRCRFGLHLWQRVTFNSSWFPLGRRCRRCGRTQMLENMPEPFGGSYFDTRAEPQMPLATTAHTEQDARTAWIHLYGFAPTHVAEGWPEELPR